MLKVKRNAHGAVITEGAAAMVLIIPLIAVVVYVAIEASYAYLIKSSMGEAAREAARGLAISYGLNPSVAGSRTLQNQQVFDKIRLANMVNHSNQFEDPVFNTASDPPTVTVKVKYLPNQYSLPPFPNPDILNLSSNFKIEGNATYQLQ